MATTPNPPNNPPENELVLLEPRQPEDWECCGSECGDACIFTLYLKEKAAFEARKKQFLQNQENLNQNQNQN